MPDVPDIAVKSLPSISPDEAHDTRVRAWAFVFQCWQARKGEQHVVRTSQPIDTANDPRKPEQENT